MSFVQAIVTAFKGAERRVPLARGSASPWLFATEHGRAPFEYNAAVRRAYLENPVAQRAVRLVAEGIAGAPLLPADPKLSALVRATSAGQSLTETLASHLLLHGNAFVQVLKDARGFPIELFALRPERMSVVAGPDGWPAAWTYTVGGRPVTIPLEDEDGAPNLIHVRHFHPADDHHGAGCLVAAEQAIAIHNAAADWNRQILENSARPSGALVYDGGDGATLTGEQFDRLRDELGRTFSGAANAGRPLLLEGGLKWQAMALSPADMDFATLKAAAARDIALAFGVPPMLLGLPGDATYANYREANRALWRLTLLPLAAKLLGALAEGLAPWFADERLAIDLDRVPALAEDRERLWSQVSAADFLDPAEKRALLGLPAKIEGNKS
ncbi:HK97 family phage portal protein [Novosphingobium chloroacetimidivorans]|uniref:HK97 family phage portal protein n=1 Tax=Novosphingobium chloroacetimidivorans TaxID=1428314 RepID=A0A7W7KCR6_9SPHN|nr:phage portal protein [Novosphingobium chloroacetimidivorans]MBB4860056.1 HK97 family phage portal protein [Novosphingobium chloroacetimidivorans]